MSSAHGSECFALHWPVGHGRYRLTSGARFLRSVIYSWLGSLLWTRDGNRNEPGLNEPKWNPHIRKNRTELELICQKYVEFEPNR